MTWAVIFKQQLLENQHRGSLKGRCYVGGTSLFWVHQLLGRTACWTTYSPGTSTCSTCTAPHSTARHSMTQHAPASTALTRQRSQGCCHNHGKQHTATCGYTVETMYLQCRYTWALLYAASSAAAAAAATPPAAAAGVVGVSSHCCCRQLLTGAAAAAASAPM
jgi:hypothetical protein